jgi:hypothetical protein
VAVADVQAFINELVDVTTTIMPVPPRLAPELVGETSRIMVQAKTEKAFKAALSARAKYRPNGSASLS